MAFLALLNASIIRVLVPFVKMFMVLLEILFGMSQKLLLQSPELWGVSTNQECLEGVD
jgi:hypothetical protein